MAGSRDKQRFRPPIFGDLVFQIFLGKMKCPDLLLAKIASLRIGLQKGNSFFLRLPCIYE